MAADFLDKMAGLSRERCQRAQRVRPLAELLRLASNLPGPRLLSLRPGHLEVIAEFKRRAPSRGLLSVEAGVAEQAEAYAQAGACAISVLTEPGEFGGRDEDIALASGAGLPVMRKDFLVDPYQVVEARTLGADGVLLIAAILPGRRLGEMLASARDAGLFALVEAFDEADVDHALNAGARLVGVNCRNLRDLSVEFERFAALRGRIAPGVQAVAESGIAHPRQLCEVKRLGYDAALIGSALMSAQSPGRALRELLQPVVAK